MPYVACLRGLCGEHRTRYLHRLPPDNIARRLLTASTRDGGCCGSRGLALGSPQLGDGAAGVSPVGQRCRRAHTGPVHPRAPQGTPGRPRAPQHGRSPGPPSSQVGFLHSCAPSAGPQPGAVGTASAPHRTAPAPAPPSARASSTPKHVSEQGYNTWLW